jgi:CDP-diglyceride synthetase
LKNKRLIITIIVFFIIVNTAYYWKGKLDFLTFPAFFILFIVYVGLGIVLIRELYSAFKENFKDKKKILTIGLLITVLALTFLKPFGFINFEELFEGKNVLIAEREGVAGCMMTLKLKEYNEFTAKSVCFGMTEINGNYIFRNDTIYFDNVQLGRGEKEFYKFAIIKPLKFYSDNKHFELLSYRSKNDTIGHRLKVTLNELK